MFIGLMKAKTARPENTQRKTVCLFCGILLLIIFVFLPFIRYTPRVKDQAKTLSLLGQEALLPLAFHLSNTPLAYTVIAATFGTHSPLSVSDMPILTQNSMHCRTESLVNIRQLLWFRSNKEGIGASRKYREQQRFF